MSAKRVIVEALKKAGFSFLRRGKHEIWSNGERNITLPSGNTISYHTLKATLQNIEGKGPFFAKSQKHIKKESA